MALPRRWRRMGGRRARGDGRAAVGEPADAAPAVLQLSAMARALVAVQLAALVVLAGVTVWRFTVWAHVDERPHYDFVQKLAEDRRMPRPSDLVSVEVQAITDRTWPRRSRTDRSRIGIAGRSYEAFQPPLYYLVAVPAFSAVGDHRGKVFALRAFDAALLLASAWLMWLLARRVARPGTAAVVFAAGLGTLLWPGVVVRAVTVGNTPLELLLATAFLLVLLRADRERRRGRPVARVRRPAGAVPADEAVDGRARAAVRRRARACRGPRRLQAWRGGARRRDPGAARRPLGGQQLRALRPPDGQPRRRRPGDRRAGGRRGRPGGAAARA